MHRGPWRDPQGPWRDTSRLAILNFIILGWQFCFYFFEVGNSSLFISGWHSYRYNKVGTSTFTTTLAILQQGRTSKKQGWHYYFCLVDTAQRSTTTYATDIPYDANIKMTNKSLPDTSNMRRRTSLQVNLSCASNLTDSGNESFNDDKALRNATVLLRRINHDDATLNKSCEQLRTAILRKTKQIFHEQSELSVKTSNVLNDTRLQGRYRKRRSNNHHIPTNENPAGGSNNFNTFKDRSISNTSIHEDTFMPIPVASSTMKDISSIEEEEMRTDKPASLLVQVSQNQTETTEERDSINTVRTSLRMNTSLNISTTSRENNIQENRRVSTNEQSRVEPTPYPMYRSVMLRSRLRQNPPCQDESRKDENIPKKKPSKKRLMPLNEHSQISLSPVEKQDSPPRYLPFRRKHKKKIIENEQNQGKTRNNENKRKNVKKIVSKKIVVKNIVDQDILNRLQENPDKSPIDTQRSNRNSSIDFRSLQGSSATTTTTTYKSKKKRITSIVTTGLSNDDKGIVKSVVKALGSARIESNVTKRTTHVVTTGVRTINLLHGIIRGCWIVGLEWVLKSLENDAWLNPQQYEMKHFSNAVLENRKDRQLFGSSYVPELFAACGYIHIENNTTPPCNVLKDLVKTAGGCITEDPRIAKVLIGKQGLKETWLFDCITSGELQPYDHYLRT